MSDVKTILGEHGLEIIVLLAGFVLIVFNAFLPAKTLAFIILGASLVLIGVFNPFIVLLFIIFVKIIGFQLPTVFIGFIEVGLNKVLGGFIVAILLVDSILKKNFDFVRVWQTQLIFCFVLLASISSFFAGEKMSAFTTTVSYATSFLIFLLLINLVKSKRKVSILVWILIVSGIVMVVLEVLAVKGLIPYRILPHAGEGHRFGSFYAQPNELAIHLAVVTPLVVYSLMRFKSNIKRAVMVGIFVLFTVSVFMTASRSGMISFVFALMLLFLFKRRNFLLWVTVLVLLAGVVLFIPEEQLIRLSTTATVVQGSGSPHPNIALRFHFIKLGIRIFADNPILGVGPGNYDYEIIKYGFFPKPAHNAYVSVLAELGIFGFVAYLLLYFVTFIDYNKARKTLSDIDPELKNMAESLFLAFLVFAVGQMAHVAPLDTTFVTIIGLGVVLKRIVVTPRCGSSSHRTE